MDRLDQQTSHNLEKASGVLSQQDYARIISSFDSNNETDIMDQEDIGNDPKAHQDQGSATFSLDYDDRNKLVIGLLIVLIVLLFITLLYLVVPPFLYWLRRRRETPSPQEEENRTERRYETIEGWLISKRVREHDSDCDTLQKSFCTAALGGEKGDTTHVIGSPQSVKSPSPRSFVGSPRSPCSPKSINLNASYDSDDTGNTEPSIIDVELGEEKECPICMEAFQIGDIVSWSPNTEVCCRHVFHHECIKEWMLQSGNCPCCRELILPIDAEGFKLERPVLKDLCRKRARLAASSFYCYTDGLVAFDLPRRFSRCMLERVKRVTACRITPQELVELRGHRTSAAVECCNDDGESSEIFGVDGEDEEEEELPSSSNEEEADPTASLLEDVEGLPNTPRGSNAMEAMEQGEA